VSSDSPYTVVSKETSTKLPLFNFNVSRTPAKITDGLSSTLAFSECIQGPNGTDDLRGAWWNPLGTPFSTRKGPNSTTPDRVWSSYPNYCANTMTSPKPKRNAPCDASAWNWQTWAHLARSYHGDGVNAAFADGSVRYVANTISESVWQDLSTINGGEAIASSEY